MKPGMKSEALQAILTVIMLYNALQIIYSNLGSYIMQNWRNSGTLDGMTWNVKCIMIEQGFFHYIYVRTKPGIKIFFKEKGVGSYRGLSWIFITIYFRV